MVAAAEPNRGFCWEVVPNNDPAADGCVCPKREDVAPVLGVEANPKTEATQYSYICIDIHGTSTCLDLPYLLVNLFLQEIVEHAAEKLPIFARKLV